MTISVCQDCRRPFGSPQALQDHRRSTHDNPSWVASKKKKKKLTPICPTCGQLAMVTETRYGMRADHCGLWSWDYKPLVDRATHSARIAAHAAFDPLWRRGIVSRGEAYRRLQVATGLSEKACHISLMNAEQALHVVEIVQTGILTTLQ